MQTFLPLPSPAESAAILDDRRLGKQRVEAKQILIALGVDVGEHRGNPSSQWRHHPAVRMWRGFERSLSHYAIAVCQEWRRRGFNDSLLEQFEEASRDILASYCEVSPSSAFGTPAWLGNEAVHRSHRSNLLRKSPEFYGQFGWAEPSNLPYVWPK
jgi:GNAT superfamily N-acetyltransferase